MNYKYLHTRSLARVFTLILITGIVASGSLPGNSKIREAIERTQTMTNVIGRCVGADDKVCLEGLALGKLAKQSAESALDAQDVSDGAKTHIRYAIQHLSSAIIFIEQGRASEALPIGNSALAALYEANKAS